MKKVFTSLFDTAVCFTVFPIAMLRRIWKVVIEKILLFGQFKRAYARAIPPKIMYLALIGALSLPISTSYGQTPCAACTEPAPDSRCEPANFTTTLQLSDGLNIWSSNGTLFDQLGDPQNVNNQSIKLVGQGLNTIIRVVIEPASNRDLYLLANATLMVENATLEVIGNLELRQPTSTFVLKNGALRTVGNVQLLENNAVFCATGSYLEIGEEDAAADGNKFNPKPDVSTTANFQNTGGYRYLKDVCMNVTHDYKLENDGTGTGTDGVDVWINVCADIGDQGVTQAITGTEDPNDSGIFQNEKNMTLIGSEIRLPMGNFQNSNPGNLKVCDVDFWLIDGSFLNSNTSAVLSGCGLCIRIDDPVDRITNQAIWTASIDSRYGETQGTFTVPVPPSDLNTTAMCFAECNCPGQTQNQTQIDLALTKTVDNATPIIGSNVTFTVTVQNAAGVADATGVEVTDLLPSGYMYVSHNASVGTSYVQGSGIWTIGNLNAGASATLTITATVKPSGDYVNVAQVTAANETDIDSTPNNLPTNEDDNDSATVTPQIPPVVIGVAKTAGVVVDNMNGTFDVTYTVAIENVGANPLYDIQLSDNLTTEFGTYEASLANIDALGEYGIVGAPIIVSTTGGATVSNVNANYDGAGDQIIIAPNAGEFMPAGSRVVLQWTIRFYPGAGKDTYNNQAVARGDSAENGTSDGDTTDDSDDDAGLNPDPDGDNNPNEPGENDPTPITITRRPVIGLAKIASTPVANEDGSYTVVYRTLVRNIGNIPLYDIQLKDNLATEFGTYEAMVGNVDAPGEYTITAVPMIVASDGGSTVATINGAYDGSSDELIVGPVMGEYLPVGASFTVEFTIRFYPVIGKTDFLNQAFGSGDQTEDGTPDEDTTDLSDDGGCFTPGGGIPTPNPDPDCDGNPSEADENDPTVIVVPEDCGARAGTLGYGSMGNN